MTINREVAEDLTQNVFLRMIKYRNSYKEGNKFHAWIYQVTRNIFSDRYQMNTNRKADFVDGEKMSDRIRDLDDSLVLDEQEKKILT